MNAEQKMSEKHWPAGKQCPNCKEWIDKRASRCPHCRSKQPEPLWATIPAVIIVVGLLIGLVAWAFSSCDSAAPEEGRVVAGGAKVQADRKVLIDELIRDGIFTKMERPGSILRVYTGRAWAGLTMDDKRFSVSLVYAYEFSGKRVTALDIIVVRDGFTGKKIGDMGGDGRLDLE